MVMGNDFDDLIHGIIDRLRQQNLGILKFVIEGANLCLC